MAEVVEDLLRHGQVVEAAPDSLGHHPKAHPNLDLLIAAKGVVIEEGGELPLGLHSVAG